MCCHNTVTSKGSTSPPLLPLEARKIIIVLINHHDDRADRFCLSQRASLDSYITHTHTHTHSSAVFTWRDGAGSGMPSVGGKTQGRKPTEALRGVNVGHISDIKAASPSPSCIAPSAHPPERSCIGRRVPFSPLPAGDS